jgi:ribosomal subunit interface protein
MIMLQIAGRNYEAGGKIAEYVHAKIGALDRFLPRNLGEVSGTVVLEDDPSGREDNRYVCEVILKLPKARLQCKEATMNMFAAVDIAEAKIKAQILKYKDKHSIKGHRARLWAAKLFRRQASS